MYWPFLLDTFKHISRNNHFTKIIKGRAVTLPGIITSSFNFYYKKLTPIYKMSVNHGAT